MLIVSFDCGERSLPSPPAPLPNVTHSHTALRGPGEDDYEEDDENDLARRLASQTLEGRIDLRQLVALKKSFDDAACDDKGDGTLTEDRFIDVWPFHTRTRPDGWAWGKGRAVQGGLAQRTVLRFPHQ